MYFRHYYLSAGDVFLSHLFPDDNLFLYSDGKMLKSIFKSKFGKFGVSAK